jgi:multidrug efflux pump subunit AcrA (membrane-fusion protein)
MAWLVTSQIAPGCPRKTARNYRFLFFDEVFKVINALKNITGNKFGRYLTSLLMLGAASVALVGMKLARKPPEESDQKGLEQLVSVYVAEDFDGKLEIDVSGIVEPHREIEIASQVAGEVLEKNPGCRAGNYVTAGTPLIRIDSRDYDLAYERLQAEKAQAEANILELDQELANLERSLELAEREFKLQEQDYLRKKKAGSALSLSEMDDAMRALTSAERSLTELKNTRRLTETRRTRLQTGIELSKVRLAEAKLNQERCQIKAPFDGVIVEDPVEQGDFVGAGDTVVLLEDISKADVKCNLRLEQLLQVVKYQIPDSRFLNDPTSAYQLPPTPVTISRDKVDGQSVTWQGTLVRYDGIGVDATTKMIPCRIEVDDPVTVEFGQPKALVRGMFVNVGIPLDVYAEEGQSLLTFPVIAMRPGDYVWSVVDGKLKQHKVQVMDRKNMDDPEPRNRMVVVKTSSEELASGAQIVTSPLAQPNPGTEVTITETRAGAINDPDSGPAGTLPATATSTSTEDPDAAGAREEEGAIRS